MRGYGGTEVLCLEERPVPVMGPGEALVRVCAIGINPADVKWRAGMFAGFHPLRFPHVPGYDIAGVVEASAGGRFAAGMRVAAALDTIRQGAYAEYAIVTEAHAAPLPDGIGFELGAAVPTPGLTGVQLIEEALDVQPGQLVLITGAAGAVGRFAMLAARARSARIVAAVRASQRDAAMRLGAGDVVTLGEDVWTGKAFDAVVDTVGGAAVGTLCRHVRRGGAIVTVATTPIPTEGLKAPPAFMAVQADGARLDRLLRAVAGGDIPVPIAHRLKLEAAAEAQRIVEAGGAGGKVIMIA